MTFRPLSSHPLFWVLLIASSIALAGCNRNKEESMPSSTTPAPASTAAPMRSAMPAPASTAMSTPAPASTAMPAPASTSSKPD